MKVHRGKKAAPDRVLLVGIEGVGKSTFAAAFDTPIFIAAEDGVRHLEVDSLEDAEDYDGVLRALNDLMVEEHDYKTVVIDSLDWVDHLVRDKVMLSQGWSGASGQEKFESYGRGHKFAMSWWRELHAAIDRLHNMKNMGVVLIAHAKVKNHKNPNGEDWMRYEPILGGDQAAQMWKAWADAVLFATHEVRVDEDNRKGKSTGRRVLHTEWSAGFDAKNRYGLPAVMPLDYASYQKAREAGQNPAKLVSQIQDLLTELGDEAKRVEVEAFLLRNPGPQALSAAVNRLECLIGERSSDA